MPCLQCLLAGIEVELLLNGLGSFPAMTFPDDSVLLNEVADASRPLPMHGTYAVELRRCRCPCSVSLLRIDQLPPLLIVHLGVVHV